MSYLGDSDSFSQRVLFRGKRRRTTIALDSNYCFKTCFSEAASGPCGDGTGDFSFVNYISRKNNIKNEVTNDPEDPRCVRLVLNGKWTMVKGKDRK